MCLPLSLNLGQINLILKVTIQNTKIDSTEHKFVIQ